MLRAIAQPFGWLLLKLYEIFGNYGVAVIVFALVVKGILLPFQMKSKRGMVQQSMLQPKLKELEKKHGANKAKYNEEIAKLYKEEGVNPASGCLWGFLPLPILFALFYAIRYPLTIMMGIAQSALVEGGALLTRIGEVARGLIAAGGEKVPDLVSLGVEMAEKPSVYTEIAQAIFIGEHRDKFDGIVGVSEKLKELNFRFLGMDIGRQPDYKFWTAGWTGEDYGLFLLPIVGGILTFLSTYITTKINPTPQPEGQQGSMKMMTYIAPVMTIYFGYIVPAALSIYWTASSIFGVVQDLWLGKRYTRIIEAENAAKNELKRAREAELEAKRVETERKKAENATTVNPNTSKRRLQTTEKQEQKQKATQWEKARNPREREDEPGRVDSRRYARGRAYDPDRFSGDGESSDETQTEPETDTDIREDDAPGHTDETDTEAVADVDARADTDADEDIGANASTEETAETDADADS